MSHPTPHHDPENTYPNDTAPSRKTIAKKMKPKANIKTLKAMINQPASKDWFKKYGTPGK